MSAAVAVAARMPKWISPSCFSGSFCREHLVRVVWSWRALEARRENEKAAHLRGFRIWWAHTDLNRGPKDYESSALTN